MDSSPVPSEPTLPASVGRSRRGRWLVGCGATLLLLPLAWLLLRDLPRRLVEGALASTLEAEVHLERLAPEAFDRWQLTGLTIERPGIFPPVARLEIESLHIEARPRELFDRHVRRLTLEGANLRLEPGAWPETSGPSPLRYDSLDPGRLRVTVATGARPSAPSGETSFLVTGTLCDTGNGPRGTLDITGDSLDIAPLLTVASALGPPAPVAATEPTDPTTDWPPVNGTMVGLKGSMTLGHQEIALDTEVGALDLVSLGRGRVTLREIRLALRQQTEGITLVTSATAIEGRGEPSTPTTGGELLVGRIDQPRLELHTTPELRPTDLALRAEALRIWRGEHRRLDARTPELELHPTRTDRLEGSLTSSRVELTPEPITPSVTAAGNRRPIETVRIDFAIDLGETGQRLEVHPQLPGLDEAHLVIERRMIAPGRPFSDSLQTVAAEWRGLRLERWLPFFDARLAMARGETSGAFALDGSSLALDVEIAEAGGSIATEDGPIALPPGLFPLHLQLDSGRPGSSASLAGKGQLDSPLGRIGFGGRLMIGAETRLELGWRWRTADLGSLLDRLVALGVDRPEGLADTLHGELGVSGRLHGPLDRLRVEATLRPSDVTLAFVGRGGTGNEATGNETRQTLEIDSLAGKIGLGWRPGDPLVIDPLELDGRLRVAGLAPRPLTLVARAEVASPEASVPGPITLHRSEITLPGARLEAHGTTGGLSGEVEPLDPSGWRGHLTLDTLDLATWLAALDPAPVWLEGWTVTGRGKLELSVEPRVGHAGPRLHGPLELTGVGFASADSSRVLEGLGARLDIEIFPTPSSAPQGGWQGRAEGRGQGFLLLVDTLFADFSTFEPELGLELQWPTRGPLRLMGRLHPLPDAAPQTRIDGTVAMAGEGLGATGQGIPWHLAFTLDDLATLHRGLLLPAFGPERVGEALEGSLHGILDGNFEDRDHWRMAGEVSAKGVDARVAGWRASGLDIRLPVAMERSGERIRGQRLHGELSLAEATGGGLVFPGLETGLWVEGDGFGLEGSITVPLYDGTVVLERLTLENLLGLEPALVAGLRFDGLQLAALSRTYDLLPLEGRLDGHLPRLRMAGSELAVDGGGEVKLFGGTVRIHGITGREVLSPFPRLTLSAELENIDLGSLTRKIDFGEMTGVLQGQIRDCELFRGIPVACQAHFETVRRRGVRRTVDVKAVNNLTILGTGQGNIFDRGLRRFFKRFTYDRLVLGIDLANDALLLRGQPVRNDREVFLSGRLPFPIEVVNAQPGRTVSFLAMRRRLESLDFDLATTEP